jgi:Na+/citrate or Na+/malate symporter
MANPFTRANLRWILIILVSVAAATGVGFLIGLWLGS